MNYQLFKVTVWNEGVYIAGDVFKILCLYLNAEV